MLYKAIVIVNASATKTNYVFLEGTTDFAARLSRFDKTKKTHKREFIADDVVFIDASLGRGYYTVLVEVDEAELGIT